MSDLQPDLDTCDCCEGVTASTPAPRANPPGQPALSYRVGNHGAFKATMLANLSRQPSLRVLSTRADDDPTIALIDGWATALDVLTFYQERIANEGFLRTATERGSILELARAIGYELRPGVAASTYLAFDLETAPGAPAQATLPVGSRVQSVPGQNEQAQTYETAEEILARPNWNRLKLRLTQPLTLDATTDRVYLKTLTTQVQKGDALLLVSAARDDDTGNSRWALRKVRAAQADAPNDRTLVVLDRPLGAAEPTVTSADAPAVYILRQRAALFGHNAPDWRTLSKDIRCAYDPPSCTPSGNPGGHEPLPQPASDWPGIEAIAGNAIDLDALYPGLVPGGWLALESSEKTQLYRVQGVASPSVSKFAMSAKVTRVTPDQTADLQSFGLRTTTVYAQSEPVELAEVEMTSLLAGDALLLALEAPDLPVGRQVLVAGVASSGEQTGEVVTVKTVDGFTLKLQKPLRNGYVINTVTVYGNVAAATHGETRAEVLGSGDAGKSFQRFELRNPLLTYLASDTASGSTTTLEVRVNAIAWQEVSSFYGHGPRDRVFITRQADDGKTSVVFGDGVDGARLPGGVENVTAAYRSGSGLAGMVKAGQLSLLMTRPLGVRSVVNPLAPAGADDPETPGQARENAPTTVLTFERIVSLADFESFAASFAGIAKARAAILWQGERQGVYVTLAGVQGAAVPKGDLLQERLRSAMRKAGATLVPFDLLSYQKLGFALHAEIIVAKGFLPGRIVQDALLEVQTAFSFDRRSLAQGVTRSEVMAAIQAVRGVEAVKLTAFHLVGQPSEIAERLIAHPARRSDVAGAVLPAQLIIADPNQMAIAPVGVFGK